MRSLPEEIAELFSRAKYMEDNHPGTAISPDYWIRLKSACEQARQSHPVLKNVTPNESKQTWAEALLCLDAIDETLRNSKTLQ